MSARYVVTGGAGMIGSHLVSALNQREQQGVVVVDNLENGRKFANLRGLNLADYIDKSNFFSWLNSRAAESIEAVFHLGACSKTTEWNGRFMMRNNYRYTRRLFEMCQSRRIRLIYASSAAVYGSGAGGFSDRHECGENPLNIYGYSKWLFDHCLRLRLDGLEAQAVGLRYFNVYGVNEQHKGSMASIVWHLHQQLSGGGVAKLFGAWDGYKAGAQQRDFIYVGDAVAVNLWFLDNPQLSGIFNCGTGRATTFQSVAEEVIAFHGKGRIEYIDFPDHLKGVYQSSTKADMSTLLAAGYRDTFLSIKQGVKRYLSSIA